MAWNRGREALKVLKIGIKVIKITGIDDQSLKTIGVNLTAGDTVQFTSPRTGITQKARIIEMTRNFGLKEDIEATLINAGSYNDIVDYWAEIEDIRRQL